MKTKNIVLKFDGKDINSSALGKDFLPLLKSVYDLVQACSEDEVTIYGIENNCIKITFVVPAMMSLALSMGDVSSVKDVARYNTAIKTINSCLQKRSATLECSDSESSVVSNFDSQNTIPSIEVSKRELTTQTRIFGMLLDVGGANPNAHIRSESFEDDVLLDVDVDVAKRLAKRLYENIGVTAMITVVGGKVKSGKVLDILDYSPIDINKWLSENSGATGVEAFDGVDIASFVNEQRI